VSRSGDVEGVADGTAWAGAGAVVAETEEGGWSVIVRMPGNKAG